MKKLLCVLLALILAFGFVSCGDASGQEGAESESGTVEAVSNVSDSNETDSDSNVWAYSLATIDDNNHIIISVSKEGEMTFGIKYTDASLEMWAYTIALILYTTEDFTYPVSIMGSYNDDGFYININNSTNSHNAFGVPEEITEADISNFDGAAISEKLLDAINEVAASLNNSI